MRYSILLMASTCATLTVGSATADVPDGRPYELSFSGTFRLDFGTGEGMTDELTFNGAGEGDPLGPSTIEGYSRTRAGPDGCSEIVYDEVTIRSQRNLVLNMVNAGTDCVDPVSSPGRILIHGSGTTEVQSGGSGTWTVEAEVIDVGPGYAEGTFGPLGVTGTMDWPVRNDSGPA